MTEKHEIRGRLAVLAVCLVLLAAGAREALGQPADEDPAQALLLSVADRFGDEGVVSVLDVFFSRRDGSEEEYRFEIWRRVEADRDRLAIFVRQPELERGIGFLLDRPRGEGDRETIRHMYLPTVGRARRLHGAGRSRLERRLGGLLAPTLIRVGPQTRVVTLGMESCGDTTCRRLEATSESGDRAEIWVEETSDPVVRRAILRGRRGRVKQSLEIDAIDEVGGRRVEASGSIVTPGKAATRFRLLEIRPLEPSEEGPFALEAFTTHAERLAEGGDRDR